MKVTTRRNALVAIGSTTIGLLVRPKLTQSETLRLFETQEPLVVSDPRPVKAAITHLEKRYGWLVTYEDPPYMYAGELENVSQVPGNVVMDLRTEQLVLLQPLPVAAPQPIALLSEVIDADSVRVGATRFGLRSSSLGSHIVPVAYRSSSGEWTTTTSVLDAQISMSIEEVTVQKYLERFCTALSQASGRAVRLATVPSRLLTSRVISLSANNQVASEILIAALQSLNTSLTWRLLYSPESGRGYYLNIVTPG